MSGSPATNLGLEIAALYRAIKNKDREEIIDCVDAVSVSISRMTALVFIPVVTMLIIVNYDHYFNAHRVRCVFLVREVA
jgi:hypothetical protein